tara:strand:+ start:112 stop:330 length:219 start_codon:yes stop_codon:yes gene_type:complete
MRNVLQVQFTYDVFKSAYDADKGLADLVKNFDKEKVTFNTGDSADDLPPQAASQDNTVANMAKSATNADAGL